MSQDKKKLLSSFLPPLIFTTIIWFVKLFEIVINKSLFTYGIFPRTFEGLWGIFTSPFIHSDFEHLLSNTFPILFLGTGLFYFYPNSSRKVIIIIIVTTGLLVWGVGRPSYHIGASGIIYGLVSFIFFSGIFRWDRRSIVLSLIVTFLYGSLTWGVLPLDDKISWESHLSGAIVGFICAIIFKKEDPYDKYAGMEDENEELPDNFTV